MSENGNAGKRDVVRPHVVDGIREYDNPMPRWWVLLFYACIAFSVAYMAYYHVFGGPSLDQEFAVAMAERDHAAQAAGGAGAGDGADWEAGLKDAAAVAAGQEAYATNCLPCHGAAGEGVVGPNLTDDHWLHGGAPKDIRDTITNGVPPKGMPAWGPILGPKKVEQLVAFILSLQGSNPPNAKAPEGEVYERK